MWLLPSQIQGPPCHQVTSDIQLGWIGQPVWVGKV